MIYYIDIERERVIYIKELRFYFYKDIDYTYRVCVRLYDFKDIGKLQVIGDYVKWEIGKFNKDIVEIRMYKIVGKTKHY